jgi:hypothetical protein
VQKILVLAGLLFSSTIWLGEIRLEMLMVNLVKQMLAGLGVG